MVNSEFPTPPVDLVTFKSGIDTLATLVTDAADGGEKAITAKNKQGEVMVKQYAQLGHYVEAASNDDPAIFSASGFVPASTQRVLSATAASCVLRLDRPWFSCRLSGGEGQESSEAINYSGLCPHHGHYSRCRVRRK
jgi:hypothetical protein